MKYNFKNKWAALSMAALSMVAISCGDDDNGDGNGTGNGNGNLVVTENISANTTWTADNVYQLGGRITVLDGATLTIEPGTVIKGEAGTGANATALVVARGGKLMANGTAELPIIFTAFSDEITPEQVAAGDVKSPNLDPVTQGLWGGVIVLGKAPSSFAGDVSEIQIEGIPVSDETGRYGGNIADDNSGVIRYISIRHGGSNIGEGNEINGLTLGGVGSATVIEHVEVVANQDDGIEWFGGTVNVTNAVVWNSGDDALDTDQAWSGTMDNFILVCGDNTDHALEIDGPEGSFRDGHTLTNGTIKGNAVSELADFRDGAQGNFNNIHFFGFTNPADSDGRGDFSLSGEATINNFTSGLLTFNNLEVVLPANTSLTDVFKNGTDAAATSVTSRSVGATNNFGWTWTSQAGALTGM